MDTTTTTTMNTTTEKNTVRFQSLVAAYAAQGKTPRELLTLATVYRARGSHSLANTLEAVACEIAEIQRTTTQTMVHFAA
jgi:hypothetical protein